ncbi:VOC family protein [Actinokineospora sp.]|uniref:VOC family protein n=1 Tax=Actinokineospora sp. TaxID=1872133 RepID=UPI0040382C9E
MTDPMDALRAPAVPAAPDPAFVGDLRERLRRAILGTIQGAPVTQTPAAAAATRIPADQVAWPPSVTPYIAVVDARRAIDWYIEVFDGHQRGELHVMPDGAVGHAEIGIGDAVLMLAEGGIGDVPVTAPSGSTHSHTLHVQVPDADTTFRRAIERGATAEREPDNQPYGRVAVVIDPFGHRWMLNTPPGTATRHRAGDVAYVTMVVADADRAKDFYGAVLDWRWIPGTAVNGWGVEDKEDFGVWGDSAQEPEVQLCYRVADIEDVVIRVRDNGGEAGSVQHRPYGLMVDCVDPLGAKFQLWEVASS